MLYTLLQCHTRCSPSRTRKSQLEACFPPLPCMYATPIKKLAFSYFVQSVLASTSFMYTGPWASWQKAMTCLSDVCMVCVSKADGCAECMLTAAHQRTVLQAGILCMHSGVSDSVCVLIVPCLSTIQDLASSKATKLSFDCSCKTAHQSSNQCSGAGSQLRLAELYMLLSSSKQHEQMMPST